jgi:hypothetical protein
MSKDKSNDNDNLGGLDSRKPPPGSWADVARMMAEGDESGFDWDAWKDSMKDFDWAK